MIIYSLTAFTLTLRCAAQKAMHVINIPNTNH